MKLLLVVVALTVLALPRRTAATHQLIGEPPRLSELEDSTVYVFETDMSGNRLDLVLPCTIMNPSPMVSYTWYRADQVFTPDMVDVNGTLTIFNITEGDSANTAGVEYYCVASKAIGKANYTAAVRSRTITVFYASFGGFRQNDPLVNVVPVGIDSDVALECDVLPSIPPPTIQWLRDGSPIIETPNNNSVRFLEGGRYLFLSRVQEDQLMPTYRCQVTNVMLDRTEMAPTTYRLSSNLTGNVLTDYKLIGNLTGFVGDMDFEFSYVGGFSSDVPNGVNTTLNDYFVNGDPIAENNVGSDLKNIARINELTMTGTLNLLAEVRHGAIQSQRTGTLTVFQRPIITGSPPDDRELVVGMERLERKCDFKGTPTPTIEWYFNGEPISAESGVSTVGNTLSIASPQQSNSGIYQCFVSNVYGEDQAAWLFEIRPSILPQVQPFNFTALDAFDDRDLGVLIVRDNSSTVSFSVDVVADPCPNVTWSFNDIELGPSNDTFRYNNPCTEEGGTSPNWTFTLEVALTGATSGRYDANFTNVADIIVPMDRAYFSIPSDEVSISSLMLVEGKKCLVEGMNVSLRCQIDGVPRPMIQFRLTGTDSDMIITPGEGIYENYIIQDFYDQITILNVNSSVPTEYTCMATAADGMNLGDETMEFDYCTVPIIVNDTATPNPSVGGEFELSCTVAGIPPPDIMWTLNGLMLESNDRLNTLVPRVNEDGTRTATIQVTDATAMFNGNYTCIAQNDAGNASRSFIINLRPNQALPLPLGAIIGIAVGGVVIILAIALVILLLVCVYSCAKRASKGNYSANPAYLGSNYPDGRGNVDKDSDEEDGQPEAFNPEYESLPALRPSQPPSYKPTPSYPMGVDDMEMRKVPLPDSDSYLGGGYMMQDNGGAPYTRPAVDDFLSEDAQFV